MKWANHVTLEAALEYCSGSKRRCSFISWKFLFFSFYLALNQQNLALVAPDGNKSSWMRCRCSKAWQNNCRLTNLATNPPVHHKFPHTLFEKFNHLGFLQASSPPKDPPHTPLRESLSRSINTLHEKLLQKRGLDYHYIWNRSLVIRSHEEDHFKMEIRKNTWTLIRLPTESAILERSRRFFFIAWNKNLMRTAAIIAGSITWSNEVFISRNKEKWLPYVQ